MKINESHGIIDDPNKSWNNLCDIIVRYIFDIKDGMLSDPLYIDDENVVSITNDIIHGYCDYKGILFSTLLPNWLKNFTVEAYNELQTNGAFVSKEAILDNGKLANVKIMILIHGEDRTPDTVEDTLTHEFRHAYDLYIKLLKNIAPSKKLAQIYREAGKGFIDKDTILILDIGQDYITLREDIWNNPTKLQNIILQSFYYSDKGELNSNLQEFAIDIKRLIIKNKQSIIESIKDSNKKKLDFNKLNNYDKWLSNVLNNIELTCYNSGYYRLYKAFLMFWKNSNKIDSDNIEIVVDNIKRPLKIYLDKQINTNLINFSGDAENIFEKVKYQQTLAFSKECAKMEKIFALYIQEIEDEIINQKEDNIDLSLLDQINI